MVGARCHCSGRPGGAKGQAGNHRQPARLRRWARCRPRRSRPARWAAAGSGHGARRPAGDHPHVPARHSLVAHQPADEGDRLAVRRPAGHGDLQAVQRAGDFALAGGRECALAGLRSRPPPAYRAWPPTSCSLPADRRRCRPGISNPATSRTRRRVDWRAWPAIGVTGWATSTGQRRRAGFRPHPRQ